MKFIILVLIAIAGFWGQHKIDVQVRSRDISLWTGIAIMVLVTAAAIGAMILVAVI